MSGETEELATVIQQMDDDEALVQRITNELSTSRLSTSQTAATQREPTTQTAPQLVADQTRMILSILRITGVTPRISQPQTVVTPTAASASADKAEDASTSAPRSSVPASAVSQQQEITVHREKLYILFSV